MELPSKRERTTSFLVWLYGADSIFVNCQDESFCIFLFLRISFSPFFFFLEVNVLFLCKNTFLLLGNCVRREILCKWYSHIVWREDTNCFISIPGLVCSPWLSTFIYAEEESWSAKEKRSSYEWVIQQGTFTNTSLYGFNRWGLSHDDEKLGWLFTWCWWWHWTLYMGLFVAIVM